MNASIRKWPDWLKCTLCGALIIFAAGPVAGVIVYTCEGVLQKNSVKFLEALAIAVVSLVGGGVLGLLFCLTNSIRKKGFLGRCVGWSIIFNAYLFTVTVLMLGAHAIDARIEIPRDFDEPSALGFMILFGIFFGIVGGVIEHVLVRKALKKAKTPDQIKTGGLMTEGRDEGD